MSGDKKVAPEPLEKKPKLDDNSSFKGKKLKYQF